MSRPALALCLLLALGLAACGSGGSPQPPASDSWSPPEACNRGTQGCVDSVVREMTRRFDPLAAACDHDAAFALMYLRVTEAVDRDVSSRSAFADRAYLAHLDAVFARYYFDAFDAWRAHRRADVPEAWRIAFELAARGRVSGTGDLLLGMNAHISRDLPFAVAEVGLRPGSRSAQLRSFDQVNRVLEGVSRPVLLEEARRFDPTIATFTLPVLAANEDNLGLILGRWRTAAVRDGLRLIQARTPQQRATVSRSIERTASARAAVIAAATSRVPFSDAGHARDAHCR